MKKPQVPKVPEIKEDTSGKNKIYYLDYFDTIKGKRQRPRVGPRRGFADKEANRIYNEMVVHHLGLAEKTYPDIVLDDLVNLYFQSITNRVAPSTIRRYKTFADNFLQFMKGNFPRIQNASEVRRVYVEELLQQQKENGHKPKTINNQIFVVKSIFKLAVEEGYIRESKVAAIKRYRDTRDLKKTEFWTYTEVEAIFDNVKPLWRDTFEFLYYSGLRSGELIHLEWDDVDLTSNPPTMTIQSKGDWTPKTPRRKIIPLNTRAVELIRRQSRSDKHNRIFKGPNGGKIKYDDMHHRLDEALKKLGLAGHLHQFRHTFATHIAMKTHDLIGIKELLGHRDIEQTMRYAHSSQTHLHELSETLVED